MSFRMNFASKTTNLKMSWTISGFVLLHKKKLVKLHNFSVSGFLHLKWGIIIELLS